MHLLRTFGRDELFIKSVFCSSVIIMIKLSMFYHSLMVLHLKCIVLNLQHFQIMQLVEERCAFAFLFNRCEVPFHSRINSSSRNMWKSLSLIGLCFFCWANSIQINVRGKKSFDFCVKASIGNRGFILTLKIYVENAFLVQILIRVLNCKQL